MGMRSFLLGATALAPLFSLSPVAAQTAAPSEITTSADTAGAGDDIVVTGTFIRGQAATAAPIQSIGAGDLVKQANFGISDLVNDLPINAGSQNQSDGPSQTFSAGTTNVNLRGLGVSSTLVLLNGQRQVSSSAATLSGEQFVDLNALIPTIAIRRVDVLKDGASTLYGSDAVAGVVNFITDSSFRGVEISANDQLTTREGQQDLQTQAKIGFGNDRLSVMVAGSFFDRGFLSASARRNDFQKRASISNFGNPQTYLVRGVLTPDPSCRAAAAQYPNAVVPPAGNVGYCRFNFGDYFALVAAERRYNGFGEAKYEISPSISAYVSGAYAHNDVNSSSGTSQSVLFTPTLPVNNPGNIFGVPASILGRPLGPNYPSSELDSTSETWRATAGLKGTIGANWSWDATYVHAQNRYSLATGDTLLDRYTAALNGQGGPRNNQFFNPLFGAVNDPAVIDDFSSLYAFTAKSKLDTVDVHVSGSLLDLPGGPLGVAVGYQHRREALSYDYSDEANANRFAFYIGNADFSGSQSVNAGFVELSAPIIDMVTLSGALRYEDFGNDNTWNPKVGILIRPISQISLRGTYSTSFRAPSLFQTQGALVVPGSVFDPVARANVSYSLRTSADPNDQLRSQTSKNYNLGATWGSEFGLTVSVDYWNFAYKNFITPESAAAVIAANPNGPQITRLSTGLLTGIRTFFRNAGALDTDGLDLQASYRVPEFGLGRFELTGNATRVLSYDLDDPIRGRINGLGNRNVNNFGVPMPKWRGNAGVSWTAGMHSISVFGRYTDSYRDDSDANYKIKSLTTFDVQYAIEIPAERFGGAKPRISVGLINAFDKNAPDALDRSGYDPLTASPLGRLFYVQGSVRF